MDSSLNSGDSVPRNPKTRTDQASFWSSTPQREKLWLAVTRWRISVARHFLMKSLSLKEAPSSAVHQRAPTHYSARRCNPRLQRIRWVLRHWYHQGATAAPSLRPLSLATEAASVQFRT